MTDAEAKDANGADGGEWCECECAAELNELREAMETSDDVDRSESSDVECECEAENSEDAGDCD